MTVPSELRTERLVLRPWRETDRAPFAALNADPEVMRYFPAPLTRGQSDAMVDAITENFSTRGWGLWAVEVVDGPAFVGFVGLNVPGFDAVFTPCVEVGWRLAKEHWSQGFASEGARAALRYGFEVVGLDQILSWTATTNAAVASGDAADRDDARSRRRLRPSPHARGAPVASARALPDAACPLVRHNQLASVTGLG